MNKKDKIIYKIGMEDIVETIKQYTTMRRRATLPRVSRDIKSNPQTKEKELYELEDILQELSIRYNKEIYKIYDLEQNKYLNPTMKASTLDIINTILISSVNLDNNNPARLEDILNISSTVKSKVSYEEFIYFQRRIYLSPVEDIEVITILRRLMYVMSHLHHNREILSIQDGKAPIYQNKINIYDGKFNTGLELWTTTLSIALTQGKITSKPKSTLLAELGKELNNLKLSKYSKNILKDNDKLKSIITVSDDLWFEREYAKNLFKDNVGIQKVIDVKQYKDIKTVDRGIMEGEQFSSVGLYNIMIRGNKLFRTDVLSHLDNEVIGEEVQIDILGDIENIKWIKMRPCENNTLPYKVLIVTYKVEDQDANISYKREFMVDMNDVNKTHWLLSTEVDYVALMVVLKYLGVLDKLVVDTENNFDIFLEGLRELKIDLSLDKEAAMKMFKDIVKAIGNQKV